MYGMICLISLLYSNYISLHSDKTGTYWKQLEYVKLADGKSVGFAVRRDRKLDFGQEL